MYDLQTNITYCLFFLGDTSVVRGHGGHARARDARCNAAADGGAAARVEVGRSATGVGGKWADAWAGPRRSGFPGSYITRRGWGVAAARAPLILVDF